jgi:CheY-like chemotaxis protein
MSIDKNLKCLLVDFCPSNRFVIKSILEKNGFIVDESSDGKELIKKINSDHQVVFLELDLPKIDGVICCNLLKNFLNYKGIIIGITSYLDLISIDNCLIAKMDDIIPKPLTDNDIIKIKNKFFIPKTQKLE